MKALRDLAFGLLSAVASGLIVLGAISLALAEDLVLQPSLAVPPAAATLLVPINPELPAPEPTRMPEADLPAASYASPTACPPPGNWVAYTIQPGDTIQELARLYDITLEGLRNANCLSGDMLLPGYIIYLPALPPTSTPLSAPPTVTPMPCGPPRGWVFYTVRPGDTLFKLSLAYRVSVFQIQFANCMGSSTYIRYGQLLYLPFIQPVFTAVPSVTRTFIPTHTSIPPSLSFTPTSSVIITPITPAASVTVTETANGMPIQTLINSTPSPEITETPDPNLTSSP